MEAVATHVLVLSATRSRHVPGGRRGRNEATDCEGSAMRMHGRPRPFSLRAVHEDGTGTMGVHETCGVRVTHRVLEHVLGP